jgi:hypothetical protein
MKEKYLAEFDERTEARRSMKGFTPRRSLPFVAAFVSAAFLWTLALGALPRLHERVHADATRADHSCAVTLIASASIEHSPCDPLVSAPAPSLHFSVTPALDSQWVQSPFLGASIFEHAPPALA